MRILSTLLLATAPLVSIWAQDALVVLPGTEVVFSANTIVSVDDLTMTPGVDFVESGFSLNKFTSTERPASNIAISRVYRFSKALENFSGSIRIRYEDDELNGLLESGLRLNIHDGSAWHAYDNNTNDEGANTVYTASLTNVQLKEITLADFASPLPLRWGSITASRVKRSVLITWVTYEQTDVSHFAVERSADARHWDLVKTGIPAASLPSRQYSVTDVNYHAGQLFYRVKGIELDGGYYYSPVRAVGPETTGNRFTLYPNPVQNSFQLSGGNAENIREVQLFNAGGTLLKAWKGSQHSYQTASLPAGAYAVRILKKDNTMQLIPLSKL